MTERATTGHREGVFEKAMGSIDALFVGFGAMIGFGWITLTGGWLADAGTWGAVIAFAVGGGIMMLVGLVYSELVSAMPRAGGEHNYLMRGMGPRWSLIGSWAITGGYITVILFEAVATPRTFDYLFPGLGSLLPLYSVAGFEVGLVWALVGVVAAVVVTWINYRGVKLTSLVQTFVVSFLLLVALVLVFGGIVGGDVANTEPHFAGGFAGFAVVLGAVPFLFVGFDVIPQASEEIAVPPRKIGRLLIISVVMAVAFYLVVIYVTSLALPAGDLVEFDLVTADALAAMLGADFWGRVVIAGGLAGILTSWIGFLLGASRLLWAMSVSGMIPAWFGRIHPRYKTPSNAILFIGALSVVAPFCGTAMLGWAVDGGSPMIVLAYALVALSFCLLRVKDPGMARPFRVGRGNATGMAVGVAALVLCVILFLLYIPGLTPISITLAWQSYLIFGLWMIVGVLFALRLPGGIKAGPDTEAILLSEIAARRGRSS
ncbi:APC family permease [Microbacterium sp. JZ31]|uniref:APC family permease n=1 Tax=Microbacterium sp. JZ31 TaxID=1906274 RepID=UPI0019318548|nr:APC family permease [Microbacterium sp. JZ31]